MARPFVTFALAVALGLSGRATQAQDKPGLIVRDVNVGFVAKGAMNDRTAFRSTVPAVVMSQRPAPSKTSEAIPQPLGVMTFEGAPTERLDVLLEYDQSARLLARWPHTDSRSTRALWRRIDLVKSSEPPSTAFPVANWLTPLRNADRLTLKQEQRLDKLIAYDLSLRATTSVELESTPTGYKARNIGSAAIHDVVVYRPTGNGKYRAAYAKEIPGLGKAAPANTQPPMPAPGAVTTNAAVAAIALPAPAAPVGIIARLVGGTPPAPAGAPPATPATPAAPSSPQHEITWVGEERTPEELLADWTSLLEAQGLAAPEIAHVQSILKAHAFDKDSARVVFRLDPATIETLAPLEISPAPDKLSRVWLVIFDGADPEIKTRIATLIAQLGDGSYAKRMEAKAQLLKLGPTAVPQLAAEKENKDPEIAFRIEEILEEVQNPGEATGEVAVEAVDAFEG